MTQRKLTAAELASINTIYRQGGFIRDLIDDRVSRDFYCHLANMHDHGTSDGKPLAPIERVPTAADIGKRVKVRDYAAGEWMGHAIFVGFGKSGKFVVEEINSDGMSAWNLCIIEQEADQ